VQQLQICIEMVQNLAFYQRMSDERLSIHGILGHSGKREVLLGSAPAHLLHSLSFADVLDETSGRGYQRKFSARHSLDFRRYLQQPGSTTIPLTFNLRPPRTRAWNLERHLEGGAVLRIASGTQPILSQVDCQHRLGSLAGVETPLAFMSFIGLSVAEEMEIFTTINGKAKGLNTSLLDYNLARLAQDLAIEDPNLYIALRLNSDEESPWRKQLSLGGNTTSGMKRRASLRTVQKAVTKFLRTTNILTTTSVDEASTIVLNFWKAVAVVLAQQWDAPRRNFVTKGIGVYALMLIAGDLYLDAIAQNLPPTVGYFSSVLADFAPRIDWSHHGPLQGISGESGASKLHKQMQTLRAAVHA
jgi:DNA sulfur modification protein DndB